ncbi:type IV pilus assembly protein PilP [Oxalobacteraceae bacterium GrIS 1.11]
MKTAWAYVLLLCLPLAGCGDSDVQEVKQWMGEVQKQTKVAVPPLVEPKTFVPFAYGAKDAVDPFSPNKLLAELAKAAKSGNAFKPDMERRKEALESFPLDTIAMVGTLQKGGVTRALLQIDKLLYQVKTGDHIGMNYGLITGVSEEAVTIKEIVQDAGGDWVERMSKLELQESKETKK